jgi:hypothetical protein
VLGGVRDLSRVEVYLEVDLTADEVPYLLAASDGSAAAAAGPGAGRLLHYYTAAPVIVM